MHSDINIKRICVLRLSAIGDCINAYAAICLLQKTYKDAQISWVIGKNEATLFTNCPGIELIPFNKKGGFKELFRVIKLLKQKEFDVLLDLHTSIRASLLTLGIKAPKKLGFDEERSSDGQKYFTNIKVPSPSSPHVIDGFMAFIQAIGCPKLKPQWNFTFTEKELAFVKEHLKGNRNLILTPCSSKDFKNWSIHGYTEICRYAISKGFNIYLCGGPSQYEKDTAEEIIHGLCEHEATNSNNIFNLVGQTSLRQLLALISKATMVISPDSGPVHMANALNVPVIGIYAHHNPLRVGPYNFLKYVVSIYDECVKLEHPDSSTIKWRTRVKDKQAMLKITSAMVREKFDEIMSDYHLE